MMYSLPYTVTVNDKELQIRNNCDYRVVLDVIEALNDDDLSEQEKLQCALFIFYENKALNEITDYDEAVKQMFLIINGGEQEDETQPDKPRLMDWKHDFPQLAPPISRTLGYEIRLPDKYTHWWTFLGGYMEIGECTFSNIISIRSKKQKGQKLEKWEQNFYKENRKMIDLPHKLSKEEQDFLDSDW